MAFYKIVIREKFRFETEVIVMGFTDSSEPINFCFVITNCEKKISWICACVMLALW